MNILRDETAHTGSIILLLLGLFLIGILYIIAGYAVNELQDANNNVITAGQLPYSQDRYAAMENIFLNFWAFPIYMIILFVIWAIKKALDKRTRAAY